MLCGRSEARRDDRRGHREHPIANPFRVCPHAQPAVERPERHPDATAVRRCADRAAGVQVVSGAALRLAGVDDGSSGERNVERK